MRIWIDGYEANTPQRLGSGQVAFELLKSLEAANKVDDFSVLLPERPMADLPKERSGWRYKILKPKFLWTRIALVLELVRSKQVPDVFFSPTHYIPSINKVPRVVVIFDLSFVYFPQMYLKSDLYKLKNWTKYSALKSAKIITISNSAKKDIVKEYEVAASKIVVCYPGYDKSLFKLVGRDTTEAVCRKYGISGRYIIYIGTIQPRKNLIKLFEAIARVDGLKLVVVGKTTGPGRSGWMYEEILSSPEGLGIKDRVIFTGFVESADLPPLLSGAMAYVLLSLYEGFGIPVVEAMAVGVPVITSDVSSLPEVLGNSGLLVNPQSVDQIELAIRSVITDERLRAKLRRLGLEQAKKYSWDKMAGCVLDVLHSVGEEKTRQHG